MAKSCQDWQEQESEGAGFVRKEKPECDSALRREPERVQHMRLK